MDQITVIAVTAADADALQAELRDIETPAKLGDSHFIVIAVVPLGDGEFYVVCR